MSKAKWLIMFLLALSMAAPTFAVELTLGGFPSFMRTRARFIGHGTFISALTNNNAKQLGFNDNGDTIFFADTTLRLTPQLVLSDAVTIRTQFNVFDNNIWGGATSEFVGGRNTVINSNLSFSDRFRGALLTGPNAIDDPGFFNVRMLHADIVLPHNLGFMRVGRQPFDWGMGILANGGWDPYSDLGFVLDRFLYLKSFGAGSGSLTFVFVSDRFTQGNSVVAGGGDGWDGGAFALIFNHPNMMGTNFTLGGYVFPYIHQTNLTFGAGSTPIAPPAGGTAVSGADLQRLTLFSGLLDVKTDKWRFVGEFQAWEGNLDFEGTGVGDGTRLNIDMSWIWAARAEVYPGWPFKIVAAEFGWAQGHDSSKNKLSGNAGGLFFNPAYNIDNLLFKHVIPNIYQQEGSVINAYYIRAWTTMKLVDTISFTPQVLVGFNQETSNVQVNGGGVDSVVLQNLNSYMGTEVEGTITWHIHPGVSFDVIGGVIFAGNGLKDMLSQQADAVLAANDVANDGTKFDDTPWTLQGRLMIFIDQFFK